MKYKAILFDMDGTLMDTLTDITSSVNYALSQLRFRTCSIDEVRMFVGNGIRELMKCSLTATSKIGIDDALLETALTYFHTHYAIHCKDTTQPYNGIPPLLENLYNSGYRMAIVSNKPQAEVLVLTEQFFHPYISVAIGENEKDGIRKKPSPDMINEAAKQLSVKLEDCVYIGDSDVDYKTAQNSHVDCISVLWGFRDEEFLRKIGASVFAQNPSDVLSLV